MKKTGFLSTFKSVCSGTCIFPELVKRSLGRALWHILILAFICSFITVAFRLYPFQKEFEDVCCTLTNRFGSIKCTDKGIVPFLNPEEARSSVADNFRVDYLPDNKSLKTYKPKDDYEHGIVWTPRTMLFWIRNYDKESWSIIPLNQSDDMENIISIIKQLFIFLFIDDSDSSFKENQFYFMSQIYTAPESKKNKDKSFQFRDFRTNFPFWIPISIPVAYALLVFFNIFMNITVITMLFILLFTSFSFLFGRSDMVNLKFTQQLIAGIYTGFPGIIIATLFVALNIEIIDFQTVFLVSYFIYSFPVFNRLRLDKGNNK